MSDAQAAAFDAKTAELVASVAGGLAYLNIFRNSIQNKVVK